jgi:hypothetical protein
MKIAERPAQCNEAHKFDGLEIASVEHILQDLPEKLRQ